MDLSEKGSTKVQYLSALSASLTSLCLGATSVWPSPVLYKFHNNEVHFQITKTEVSWILAMSPVGFLLGSVLSRYVADNVGRRATILASALPMVIGSVTATFGWNAWFLYVARIVWGLGTGMAAMVVPMYIGEISDKDIRGKLTTFTRVLGNLGSLVILSGGSFMTYTQINVFLMATPLIYFAACWWIPESPYYYMKEGKTDDARNVMMMLQKHRDSQKLDDAVSAMQERIKEDMSRGSNLRELFTGRVYRKPLIIVAGLRITQILTGVGTVQQYLGQIMQESGSTVDVPTAFIIVGAVNFVIGLVSSALVDLFGRRPLFVSSSFGLGMSLFVVGFYFLFQEVFRVNQEVLRPYAIVAFIGIISSLIMSSIGVIPLSVVIPAEIFSINVKAVALSSTNVFASLLGWTVALAYQGIKDSLGLCGVFWCYAAVGIFGAIFTYVLLPETKGKSLEEIQIELQRRTRHEEKDKMENGLEIQQMWENVENDKDKTKRYIEVSESL